MEKIMQKIFLVYIILVFGYFAIGEMLLPQDDLGADAAVEEYNGTWERILPDGSRVPQEIPGNCDVEKGTKITVETVLPEDITEDVYLCFRSGKQDMEFYVDGELRQVYNTDKTRLIGSYSAVAYIFVKINAEDAGKTLTFTAQTASSYSGILYEVYQGSQMAIWTHYFMIYGSEMIVALIVLLLSAIVIIASVFLQHVYKRNIDLEYLGWGVAFAGIWIITNSVFRQLLFPNMSVVNDIAFYMVMLLPIPFLFYINGIQKGRYKIVCYSLELAAIVDFAVCTVLHITRVVDFAETITIMAFICVLTIFTLFVTLIIDLFRGYVKEYRLVSWGMVAAFLSAIVQIAAYFQRTKTFSGVILAVGLILLIIFATCNTVVDLIRAEREKQNALMANKSKGEFLARMSHEIRTPINAVLGLDTMILRESSEEQIREYAMDIDNAGKTLLALINDILDLSKIDSGKMEIIPMEYEFSSLIYDVVSMVAMKADEKDLQVELDLDPELPAELYGDDVRLRQILVNLMNNAVKYTEQGSVLLRINGKTDGDEATLHFEVRDTGIGIKKEDLGKLFTAFERIEEERNRNVEGTGLGMSITVQLLAMMDSKLKVESVYGKGSIFYFDLKQRIVNATPIGSLQDRIMNKGDQYSYAVSFIAPQAQILVVDDNAMNRKVFCSLLKCTQIPIEEAGSGAETLELVLQKHYDIIFLDHMMPDMNGIQVLQTMRGWDSYPNQNTPVIALTANAVTGAKEMYLEAGFDDFLSKPINPDKLEKMIQDYLPVELIQSGENLKVSGDSGLTQNNRYAMTDHTLEESEELPNVEGIDWDYALLKLKDTDLLLGCVQDYTLMAESDLMEIRRLWKELDNSWTEEGREQALQDYRVKIHSMKTSAAMIGATGVSGLAKILEYAARDGEIDRIRELTGVFAEEWDYLQLRLKETFSDDSVIRTESADSDNAEDASGQKPLLSVDMLQQYLQMLNAAMEELDVDTADAIVEEFGNYQLEENVRCRMHDLQVAVRNLDDVRVREITDGFMYS